MLTNGQPLIRIKKGDIELQFPRIRGINYVLYHCDIPILNYLLLKNTGTSHIDNITITISIPGYCQDWIHTLERFSAGETKTLSFIKPRLNYEKLETHAGRKRAQLIITLNDSEAYNETIEILGFYEWPLDPAYRKSLASFVQPTQLVVQHFILEAIAYLKKSKKEKQALVSFIDLLKAESRNRVDQAMKAIYTTLRDKFRIHYVFQPPNFERKSQLIRPANQLILKFYQDPRHLGQGAGTCVDLCLFFASCLENIHLQPLIIFLKKSYNFQHTILGCWTESAERYEPIIYDFAKLNSDQKAGKLILLETVSVTDYQRKKYSYSQAKAEAKDQFISQKFIFALDISAARQTVKPLQFPMNIEAMDIIRSAEILAQNEGNPKLETRHLLASYLLQQREKIVQVLQYANINPEKLDSLLHDLQMKKHPGKKIIPKPTINYRRVLYDAKHFASDAGLGFVEASHIFYALLFSPSISVNNSILKLGLSPEKLRNIFEQMHSWTKETVQTYYEPLIIGER